MPSGPSIAAILFMVGSVVFLLYCVLFNHTSKSQEQETDNQDE